LKGWKCIIQKEDIQEESNLRKDSEEIPPCSRRNLTKDTKEALFKHVFFE